MPLQEAADKSNQIESGHKPSVLTPSKSQDAADKSNQEYEQSLRDMRHDVWRDLIATEGAEIRAKLMAEEKDKVI
jgi:hypothetical protein